MNIIKRIKPLGWFALCSLFVFAICLPFLFFSHASHASKQVTHNIRENYQTPKSLTKNEVLKGAQGMYLQTELTSEEAYSSLIHYPYTMIEDIDARILDWITNEKELFMNQLTSYKDSNPVSHLSIQFDIHTLTKSIYNLTATAEHSFDKEMITNKTSFIIDLSKQRHLTLEDIFLNSSKLSFKEFIDQEIHSMIEDETVIQQFIDGSSIGHLNWGLSTKYLSIYPHTFEEKAEAFVPTYIQIPIEQVAHFVQDQWLEPLKLTDEIAIREQARKKANETASTFEQKDLDGKYIALTFDDGPHPDVTPRILETLDIFEAKATFFMLGLQVEKHPNLAADVARQGHEIANHSQTHRDLTTLNQDQLKHEIQESNEIIHQITGQKPSLYRPPFGSYNEHIKHMIEQNELTIMLWSVDSLDWKNRNEQTITSTVTADATVDATILMHDIHPTTADALPKIMQQLSNDGYKFVTVSELLAIQDQRNKNEAF